MMAEGGETSMMLDRSVEDVSVSESMECEARARSATMNSVMDWLAFTRDDRIGVHAYPSNR